MSPFFRKAKKYTLMKLDVFFNFLSTMHCLYQFNNPINYKYEKKTKSTNADQLASYVTLHIVPYAIGNDEIGK